MTEPSNQESRSGDASAPDRRHAASNGAEIAFVDARVMHGAAMARLAAGDWRDRYYSPVEAFTGPDGLPSLRLADHETRNSDLSEDALLLVP